MPIPLVSSNQTNQVWIGRTNQAIGVINSLTDGALTLNGSITFSNASFSLSLPSLNVNNSIVVTGTSGNTVFLNSSNAVVNGTIYVKGSGNSLYVTNNAIVTGNLTVNTSILVGSTLSANGEIIGNANVQVAGIDGQFRAVQGNFGVILRNDGNSFYILQTGSVSNATTAAFNSMQPLTWNLSTGILTLDASKNGTVVAGNLFVTGANTSLNVSNNVVVQGNLNITGPSVTITNSANIQGQLTTGGLHYSNGGIQMSNTAITFDKLGTTFIQYNQTDFGGNGALQLSGNIQVNGQMVVTGTATFTNTVTFQTATDSSLNVTNSVAIGNNLTVVNKISAGNGVFSDLHSTGRTISDAEVVAKTGGSFGQFRAVTGNFGGFIRNDGTNFFLMTTGSVANPDTATFNTLRPFFFNLATGVVNIDGTAAGVTIGGSGGSLSIGNQAFNTGLGLNTSFVTVPNGGGILGKDSGGTVRNLIGVSSDNYNQVFIGPNGNFRVLNIAGTALLTNIDNSGNMQTTGSLTVLGGSGINLISGTLTLPNSGFVTGRDNGGTPRPSIGIDSLNNNTAWCGPNSFRVISFTGAAELVTLLNNGNINFNAPLMSTIGSLSIGGPPISPTTGGVSAYLGYQAKAGTTGGFRTDFFNIDWNGSASAVYIDSTVVAFFPAGFGVSDRRLKTNIETNNIGALEKIKQLRTVSYRLRNNEVCKNLEAVAQLGYIADELEQIIPEAVGGTKDAMDGDKIVPQHLNIVAIIATATQAITELADKYDLLEKRIATLEKLLNTTTI